MMIAQTSRDPKDWTEDSKEEAERSGLLRSLSLNDPEKNAKILRTYYPLKARLKKTEAMLGFQPGTVLKYARVRHTPHRYPIEVYFTGRTASGEVCNRRIGFDSTEVEIVPAV